MLLILMRHGEAVSETVDPSRPLSARGREEVERSARFLKNAGVDADLFYHSTKKRAKETAHIARAVLNPEAKLEQKSYLSPNDSLEEILKDIATVNQNLLIAGHMPFLPRLVSQLVVNDENQPLVAFSTGGVVILEKGKFPWLIREVSDPRDL